MHIPKPEFPRPDKERKTWLNLNGAWDFCLFQEVQEDAEQAFSKNRVDYPDTITVPFSWTCPLSGIQKDVPGIGWYRKRVLFPAEGRIFLCFGAVDYIADVYVNGQFACHHQGGYTCFEADVTKLWKQGSNIIEVRAEDYRRDVQLYGKQGYGEIQGIWQTVWLECRPAAYIRDFRVVTRISGEVTYTVDADAPDGAILTAKFGDASASAKVKDQKALLTLSIEEPRLWSPDDPYLYEGTLALKCDNETDTVHTYFGIREIGCQKFGSRDFPWITLNGKPIYLNGTLDQAFNPSGYFTYPDEKEIKLEAWRLKRIGLNMVRIHIKPEEPRKLYWLDKMGILVMEDVSCFWGEPCDEAKSAYETEWPDILKRDLNHPGIFAWVLFNETWGLKSSGEGGKSIYLPETQEWVRSVYRRAKLLDPTRFVEDNSPCNHDHVESDLNTWHFYINGYDAVKKQVNHVAENCFPGSTDNYIGGNVQTGAPLMNSECGMVWGVDHSAGDSDLAWHYHYMMNIFRAQEKLCGFVFTEFHDVVNEFNGYYRIDGQDKDFGFQDFCRGMSLRDLHAPLMVVPDCPPAQETKAGEEVSVPLDLSCFSETYANQSLILSWEMWHDGPDGHQLDEKGKMDIAAPGFGLTHLPALSIRMPNENALEILSMYLKNQDGQVISRNFTTFNVHEQLPFGTYTVPVSSGKTEGFSNVWQAMGGQKLCMGGSGMVTYRVKISKDIEANDITILLEGSSKRVLAKDQAQPVSDDEDGSFMRGYRVDRGAFINSYWMTDESRYPSEAEVLMDGQVIDTLHFDNDWADARGVLSWLNQPNDRRLDEAGSYGELKRIRVPSRLIPAIKHEGEVVFSLRVKGGGGLALYDRESGRYAQGILVKIE